MDTKNIRIEADSMGNIEVPLLSYYGSQTERSKRNFDVATSTDKMPELVIKSLILLKISCAEANAEVRVLLENHCKAIVAAGSECLLKFDKWESHFPLVVWQTGSGTQSNMNVNEVLANLANKSQGFELGSKKPIHPNDHVNLGQSSNDAFPSAMHIATVIALKTELLPALQELRDSLQAKQECFGGVIKIGRTHLQDAVPLTVGHQLGGYIDHLDYSISRLRSGVHTVASQLAIGGTAVGTGLNTFEGFDKAVCQRLTHNIAKYMGISETFSPATNKFAALAGHDCLMSVAGDLNTLATALMKIANDFRLLGSGPRCGLGEFVLPENEPGSSIMPGKINPTQCESMSMVCAQVMGNYVAISIGASQGHLELNVFKPLIIRNVLHSIRLLGDSCRCFSRFCVSGLTLNEVRIAHHLDQSLMLATALNPLIGYDKAARIATHAHANHCTLREAALALHLVSEADFDRYVDPSSMLGPAGRDGPRD